MTSCITHVSSRVLSRIVLVSKPASVIYLSAISRLLLIVSLILTGLGLSFAKGQGAGMAVQQAEICIGLHVVTVHLDENGDPVSGIALCPDAGQALMRDAGLAFVVPPLEPAYRRVHYAGIGTNLQLREGLSPQARDPPEQV